MMCRVHNNMQTKQELRADENTTALSLSLNIVKPWLQLASRLRVFCEHPGKLVPKLAL